jgi:hypothetical protein
MTGRGYALSIAARGVLPDRRIDLLRYRRYTAVKRDLGRYRKPAARPIL